MESSHRIEVRRAEKMQSEGIYHSSKGDFGQAISKFKEAERIFAEEKKDEKRGETLILLGQAYQTIGLLENSLDMANTAANLAESSQNFHLKIKSLNLAGSVCLGFGQTNTAREYLEKGLQLSRKQGTTILTASVLNNLGNLYTTLKMYDKAYLSYMECVSILQNDNALDLRVIALTNAATAAMRKGHYEKSKSLVDEALSQTASIGDTRGKGYALINAGLIFKELSLYLPEFKDFLLRQAFETLALAANVASKIGDVLGLSYACGYLGDLYENESRFENALNLTRMAMFKAQEANAPEALFRWQWQAGRIFNSLGNIDQAIVLYRNSIETLSLFHAEKSGCYGQYDSSVNESTQKISFELVELLLQRAASLEDPDEFEPYLIEAREVLELRKLYELRNYYHDDCINAFQSGVTSIDRISKEVVILYPVVLEDRIEVLYSLPEGLRRFSVEVGKEELSREISLFRRFLEKRTTREFLPHAQRLYDWLIRPLEKKLASVSADTLVFIPDGSLRRIPMAALHDGKRFLIEKHAIAVTPGLELTDPVPLVEKSPKALLLGLTESTQGFPPLPYVSSELQGIQTAFESKLFLNEQFMASKMEEALKDQKYGILHIASHAQFGGDVENAFIVAYDGKLSVACLNQYIGLLQFRDDPLELLTLSACETAAGNDEAALGLAGIAVRAGARSALASLWHVNDLATSVLIEEFYRQLGKGSNSRAQALRMSQLKLLSDPRFGHPGYWSPFLIINNWL